MNSKQLERALEIKKSLDQVESELQALSQIFDANKRLDSAELIFYKGGYRFSSVHIGKENVQIASNLLKDYRISLIKKREQLRKGMKQL